MSEAAVSQVLNNRPCRISEDSRRRILECAQRMNYHANRTARGLATNRSDTLGLIVPDIENPFFSALAKRLERQCRATGYGLFIANSDDEAARDAEQLLRLDALGVDGIVFVPSAEVAGTGREGLLDSLGRLSVPLVMVDRAMEEIACDKVVIDNRLGARLACDHLLGLGHMQIACLANTHHSQNGRLRLEGYRESLAQHGVGVNEALVAECDYHGESAYAAVDGLLAAGATALFSTSDLMTAGVMRRLTELGLKVPEDISVVSFDRNEASALFMPNITSVYQDVAALAGRALELLSARIDAGRGASAQATAPTEFQRIVIQPTLVVGTSTAAPRG